MTLSKRLSIIVACAVIGLILMAGFSLRALRSSMLEDRRNEIHTVLNLATKQVAFYQEQEQNGKLSRADAQAKALEALSTLRDGKTSYLWARTSAALGLVHPNPDVIGKVDFGARLPDGRLNFQVYLDTLATTNFAYFDDMVKKPGTETTVPKINGVTKIAGWDWIVGFGVFVDDIDAAFWRLAWGFVGLGVLILAVVAGLAFMMARSIHRSLGGEPDYAATVALAIASGDLSHRLENQFSHDSLLGSMARMQSGLRQMIESIQHGAHGLSEAATSISGQMAQINKSSHESADATTSTAAAIEELSVSIEHISSGARDTEENSARSSALAENGEKLVLRASETIQGVSQQIADASAQISQLRDQTNQISGIAGVIKDIADQTNLLALNAAIEAARAGEQGRGFAVVADEVRKLAERTTQATNQITSMTSAIQNDTGTVVSSMQAVTPRVEEGVNMAREAAAALREISEGVTDTLNKVRAVASSTAEQTEASSSVAQNVERISQMVEESAASVLAANENVRRLESLASELRSSVTRFRL